MKLKLIFLILLYLIGYSNAISQNLVPNPSFEDYDSMASLPYYIEDSEPWFDPKFHMWSSADLWNIESGFVPGTPAGDRYPRTGDAFSGLICYTNYTSDTNNIFHGAKEYIAVKLTSPLISGFTYTVSYYYSVGEIFSNSFVTNLGVLFVNDTSSINTTLHITNAYTNITYNYNNWYEYSANYTANGNESFLIIGNFNTVSNTNYIYDSANSLFDYNTNYRYNKVIFFL
jgi:hypothetical protein